jgi:type IV pilus assembly protein PilO
MKISRTDRNLLILLAVIVAFAAYYFLLFVPQENKIKELEASLETKKSEKSVVDLKLASAKRLDENIATLKESIATESEAYYSQISQEEMLATISTFAEGLPLSFTDMSFSDNASTLEGIVKYQATVGFSGDYDSLLAYIRNIRNNEDKIIVREVSVNNNFVDGLKGKLLLEFNAIPSVASYVEATKPLVTAKLNTRDILSSPFEPYENFVVVEETTSEMPVEVYPEYEMETTEAIDYEAYRPKTQIYGFEDGSNFFVGNSTDINGFLTRSKTSIAGGYSADLSFDFVTGREFSEANIVFETNPIMINKQAEYLGVWVYAYEASNHAIGAVIIDSKGKEFRVELAPTVDWTQWQEVEALLPVEISYPCMVQRIYVEGIGYDQKLTGKYLFDQLQVSYPVQ